MSPKSSKVLRKSKGGTAPKKRSRNMVNFNLDPDELIRVQADVLVAANAAGVPVSLAGFAKSATLEYGPNRRKLAAIRKAVDDDVGTGQSALGAQLFGILEGS